MTAFRKPSFPPHGEWDRRLERADCDALQPVEKLHENPWFAVYKRGGHYTTEYHERHVAVLPVIEERWVVMVRVLRPVIDDMTLEFPAGGTEPDESPVAAAVRELREEAGIAIADASRLRPLAPIAVSSARMPRLSYVFRVDLAEREFDERNAHDHEIHSVERIAVADLPRLMNDGTIYVSVPLAMLGRYLASRTGPDIQERKRT